MQTTSMTSDTPTTNALAAQRRQALSSERVSLKKEINGDG